MSCYKGKCCDCCKCDLKSAGWDESLIELLNKHQTQGDFHPYTCGNDQCRTVLTATKDGWVCEICGYRQNWAH